MFFWFCVVVNYRQFNKYGNRLSYYYKLKYLPGLENGSHGSSWKFVWELTASYKLDPTPLSYFFYVTVIPAQIN